VGRPDGASFVNGVVEVATRRRPRALKRHLRRIEHALGRVRTADRDADRTIDLDLVLYDDLVVRSADLVLPDPEIGARAFLASPLHELAPELVLPDERTPIRELALALGTAGLCELSELTSKLKGLTHE
jgi:7,8-dihydro-6-hydroxymethylpterin-pyrophosphokinase